MESYRTWFMLNTNGFYVITSSSLFSLSITFSISSSWLLSLWLTVSNPANGKLDTYELGAVELTPRAEIYFFLNSVTIQLSVWYSTYS